MVAGLWKCSERDGSDWRCWHVLARKEDWNLRQKSAPTQFNRRVTFHLSLNNMTAPYYIHVGYRIAQLSVVTLSTSISTATRRQKSLSHYFQSRAVHMSLPKMVQNLRVRVCFFRSWILRGVKWSQIAPTCRYIKATYEVSTANEWQVMTPPDSLANSIKYLVESCRI